MSETHDYTPTTTDEEQPIITGELHINLDADDRLNDLTPSIDDLLAGNDTDTVPDDSTDDEEPPLLDPAARFPVESTPEHVVDPADLGYAEPVPTDHVPPFEDDEHRARRLRKEAMSRQERLRQGW